MFQKCGGEVVWCFYVVVIGIVDGNMLMLDECFCYDDGEIQICVWILVCQFDKSWCGCVGDVIGEVIGYIVGNVLYWNYMLLLLVNDK